MSHPEPIRERDRAAVVQSLRAGVVPRKGLHHIQVGRVEEVKALISDIDRLAERGAAVRFIIGEYGSGKTFFLNLIRTIALEKRCVTLHADLSPDRRLFSTRGQARALYSDLMRNLSTRSKPDGGALPGMVERFVAESVRHAKETDVPPDSVILEKLALLSEEVGGYDFAEVIAAYWRGHDTGNDRLKGDALRWLRGEFGTRTEARKAVGVRTIVDDANVVDHLRLMGRFALLAGYSGILVCLDEMVNLFRLANTRARAANYEQVLRMVNDCLQGNAEGIGILFSGTPDFLSDERKGLYSYPALKSRLGENTFARDGLVDYTGPVLTLENLSPEDLFVLLGKLRHLYASGDPEKYLLPDEGLQAFMAHCLQKIGEAYFRTPRNTITAFINLLAVLEQNPGTDYQDLVGSVDLEREVPPDPGREKETGGADGDDDLKSFRL